VTLTMDEVNRIATLAAHDASPALQLAGVTFGATGDSAYVEVLVNITGCRTGACQISVGAFRNVTAEALRIQIADKLRDHLLNHSDTP
jgi:hypothetical protein